MILEHCVCYDVEVALNPKDVTGGFENPEGLGFSSAVAYSWDKDQYFFFLHEEGRKGLIDLLDRKIAVSFNGIKFDSRVVLGNDRTVDQNGKTFMRQERSWDNIDLLLEYIKVRFSYPNVAEAEKRLGDRAIHDGSFSLDGLAEGTLGMKKTGHGAQAPILYQEKKYEELLSYNLMDTRLTRKLFDFVREYGFLVDRKGRTVRISL